MTAGSSMDDFLYEFIDGLPKRITYDRRPYSEIRREFLGHVSQINKEAFCLLYLAGAASRDEVELILTNSSSGEEVADPYPKIRRARISKRILKTGDCDQELANMLEVNSWLKVLAKPDFKIISSVLKGPDYSDVEGNSASSVEPAVIGLVLFFFPNTMQLTTEKMTALKIFERLLIGDISNSRLERSALAANDVLHTIRKHKDILSHAREICVIFNRFTQSSYTLAFRVDAGAPTLIGSSISPEMNGESELIKSILSLDLFSQSLQTRKVQTGLSNKIPHEHLNFKHSQDVSWLVAPCIIDAIDLRTTLTPSGEMTFIVFVMIGKSSRYYLGQTYSDTDLEIARKLCSIISTHIPAMLTSTYMRNIADSFLEDREISQDVDEQNAASRIFESAQQLNIAIKSVILVEVSENGEVETFAEPALADFAAAAVREKTFLIFESKTKSSEPQCLSVFGEQYLCWDVGTDFRNKRLLLLSVGRSEIPVYFYQVLKTFVENYYLYIRTQDFFAQQIAILAQVRHALRGPLAAAMGILRLMADRHSRYKSMPTKFARIMDTPTMREWIPNALRWTEQAYLLADAPRYLLGAINFEDIRWGDVDVVEIVRSVIQAMSSEISRRDLKVEFAMGDTEQQFVVSADTMLIWTVIFNLIDNAVKYSYAGRRISVAIDRVENGEKWRLSVTNIGVPIDPDERKRIFKPWTRARKKEAGRRRPGTGLGLAVCQQILIAHDENAIFDVDSELIAKTPTRTGRSEFFFELPIKGKAQYEAAEDQNFSHRG